MEEHEEQSLGDVMYVAVVCTHAKCADSHNTPDDVCESTRHIIQVWFMCMNNI